VRNCAIAVALLAPLAACSGVTISTSDFELVHRREGEGRPAVTALAFEADGRHLLVGDFRGALERLDCGDGSIAPLSEPREASEILAFGWRGDRPLPVARSAAALGWGRLSGALATREGALVGWSALTQKLWTQPPSAAGVAAGSAALDVPIVAAAIAREHLLVLQGRTPAAARLECRDLATLALAWFRELPRPAHALCVLPERELVIVADDAGVELRSLAGGDELGRVDAEEPPARVCSLNDGRRVLLVGGDDVSVLSLGESPRIDFGFAAHRGGVTAVAVSDDGTLLATGGARGDLLVLRILPDARGAPRAEARSLGAAP
jgi:hypothetical protein